MSRYIYRKNYSLTTSSFHCLYFYSIFTSPLPKNDAVCPVSDKDIQKFHKIILSNSFLGISKSTKGKLLSNFLRNLTNIFHKIYAIRNLTKPFCPNILSNCNTCTCLQWKGQEPSNLSNQFKCQFINTTA